jgi:hypothetical protein
MIERYFHKWGEDKGTNVFVRSDLKGMHRAHCLCWEPCARFKPGTPENCNIAQGLYEYDIKWSITTPVWECPFFEEANLEG